MSPPGHSRAGGFTLVELVIGSVVLSGVLLAAYLTLEVGLKSDDLLEWRRDASQGARAALALLAADLRSACRLSEDVEFIGMDRELDGIEADNLDFGTRNWRPEAPGESDFAEASWYVSQDPVTKEIGLWRRRDSTADLEPLAGGRTEEILAPIAGFRLEYYDGFFWEESWGGEQAFPSSATGGPAREPAATPGALAAASGLPSAVRITIALAPPGSAAESLTSRPAGERSELRPAPDEARPGTAAPLIFRTTVHLNLSARESSARGGLSASPAPAPATGTPSGSGGR